MTVTHVSKSVRVVGIVAALPLALGGCAPAADLTSHAAELRASAGSDVLEVPTVIEYRVTEARLASQAGNDVDAESATEAVASRLEPNGFIVINDNVITEAELGVRFASFPSAEFTQTSPTVLRRPGGEDLTVTAVGTLSFDDVVHHDVQLRLTPTVLDDEVAEFDVSVDIPSTPLIADGAIPLDQVTAHVVFAAE